MTYEKQTKAKSGEEFIKNYEGGLKLNRYNADVKGEDWTIGYGHKLFNNPIQSITKEEAQKLFDKDVEKMITTSFESFLKRYNIQLTQHQFDAMLSFTFNMGENIWSDNPDSSAEIMKNFLIKGDYSEEATRKAFSMYMGSKANDGHIARRNDEINMFLYGDYKREYDYTRP